MRQVWITRKGGPDVLELREADDPRPGPGELRIRVSFSGLNFADLMARMGLYQDAPPLPAVVGYEVSGTVDALGEGVDDLAIGDRVVALTRFGGHADVVVVPREQVSSLPDAIELEAAAALPVNYLTAWLMLIHLGNVQRGDRVLVHAVAGGVGQAALQLCQWRGAEVIGTASGAKHQRLRDAGVAHCIDYRTQDFEAEVQRITDGAGVQIALDAVGGASFAKSYRSLASMGRLFMFGMSSMAGGEKRSLLRALGAVLAIPRFKTIPLLNENRGVFGVNLGHLWHEAARLQSMLGQVIELVEAETLAPVVDRVFPLEQADEAHRYLQSRQSFGKVLLGCR
jgi:NADPH:quinone reductase-like Zn-dependent oxidoreductase